MLRSFIFFLMLSLPVLAQPLLITDAVIHPMDKGDPRRSDLLIQDGKVLALGEEAVRRAVELKAEIRSYQGRHVFPGFIDAHAHLMGLGEQGMLVDLRGTTKREEAVNRIVTALSLRDNTCWLRGRGWDQNHWPDRRFPSREDLDAFAPKVPVCMTRIDGHAVWVNTAALEAAGISDTTMDPEGGRIQRDSKGQATGILLDNAVDLIYSKIPPPTPEIMRQAYSAAIAHCHRVGLTSVHDMGIKSAQIQVLRTMIADGEFPFRLVAYVDGLGKDWEELLRTGRIVDGEDQLILDGLKLYADGALGSRGAALLHPYSDDPGNVGISITTEACIRDEAIRALKKNLRVCVHAIGDAANRTVLNAYEKALNEVPGPAGRLRVEHVQVLDRMDIPRFAKLGITASIQPTHCTSDMLWAEARLGSERVRHAYAWGELRDAGANLCGGSDFPIEKPDPLDGVYAASTRRDADGRPATTKDLTTLFTLPQGAVVEDSIRFANGWYGFQRLSRNESLHLFLSKAAAAAGLEGRMGVLAPGAWADFIITDRDLEACSDEELRKAVILETWSGGRQVYRREE